MVDQKEVFCYYMILREVERKSPIDRLLLLLNDHVRRPKIPVTTFLKVAYGTRENPGGSGTFSEVTLQTTEQRGHFVGKPPNSVRTGQQLQLGGDRGKAWPKQDFNAPFVYRLGHPPFTQVRGVRFSYGVPNKYKHERTAPYATTNFGCYARNCQVPKIYPHTYGIRGHWIWSVLLYGKSQRSIYLCKQSCFRTNTHRFRHICIQRRNLR